MRAIRIQSASQWASAERLHREVAARPLAPAPGMALVSSPPASAVDRRGRVWLALDGDVAAGTIRASYGADGDLAEHLNPYGLAPILDVVGAARIVVYDRFEVLPRYRSSLAALLLMKVAAEDTLRRGIDIAVYACEPDSVSYYESLGFRCYRPPHARPNHEKPVPLLLVYSDRAHLAAVDSPIRRRIPARIPTGIDPGLARLLDDATQRHRCRRHVPVARSHAGTVTDRISDGLSAWWRG